MGGAKSSEGSRIGGVRVYRQLTRNTRSTIIWSLSPNTVNDRTTKEQIKKCIQEQNKELKQLRLWNKQKMEGEEILALPWGEGLIFIKE